MQINKHQISAFLPDANPDGASNANGCPHLEATYSGLIALRFPHWLLAAGKASSSKVHKFTPNLTTFPAEESGFHSRDMRGGFTSQTGAPGPGMTWIRSAFTSQIELFMPGRQQLVSRSVGSATPSPHWEDH